MLHAWIVFLQRAALEAEGMSWGSSEPACPPPARFVGWLLSCIATAWHHVTGRAPQLQRVPLSR